jgi:adiponectin receptor
MITTATTTATRSPVARSRKLTIHSALTPCITYQPPPQSLDALDLSSSSPAAAFAALHDHVLSCLADIEASLSQLESPLPDFDLGQAISRSELKVEEVRAWAKDGLEILKQTRAEIHSHLPEFTLDSVSVPELPRIPRAEQYICNLSDRLKSLQSHLSSFKALSHVAFPSFPSIAKLSELIDTIISSDRLPVMLRARSMSRSGDPLGRAATEVARAIERSVHGAKLITYGELPSEWRNNPFVTHGYRFVSYVRVRTVADGHVPSQLHPS